MTEFEGGPHGPAGRPAWALLLEKADIALARANAYRSLSDVLRRLGEAARLRDDGSGGFLAQAREADETISRVSPLIGRDPIIATATFLVDNFLSPKSAVASAPMPPMATEAEVAAALAVANPARASARPPVTAETLIDDLARHASAIFEGSAEPEVVGLPLSPSDGRAEPLSADGPRPPESTKTWEDLVVYGPGPTGTHRVELPKPEPPAADIPAREQSPLPFGGEVGHT